MILDTVTRLEAVLEASAISAQPQFSVIWLDYFKDGNQSRPGFSRGAMTHVTDKIMVSAPPTLSPIREIRRLSIYNADSASRTVTVKTDDSATEVVEIKHILLTTQSLVWERQVGWYVI